LLQEGRRKKRDKGPPPSVAETWWPLIPALVLGFFSPQIYAVLEHQISWITWFVFPFVLLSSRHELGLSPELANSLPELMTVIQFPLEGLLTVWNLRRRASFAAAIGQLLFLHALGAFVLFLLNQPK